MKRFSIFIAFMLLVTGITSVAAQDLLKDLLKFKARVKVSITADDDIKGTVTSYIHRELRSLNDVEIVDSDPEWELMIIAMEAKTTTGHKTGNVLSVLILSKFNNSLLLSISGSNKEIVSELTSHLYHFPEQWFLRQGPTKNLKDMCDKIVADFDTSCLEESRKSHREMMELLQKSIKAEQMNPKKPD